MCHTPGRGKENQFTLLTGYLVSIRELSLSTFAVVEIEQPGDSSYTTSACLVIKHEVIMPVVSHTVWCVFHHGVRTVVTVLPHTFSHSNVNVIQILYKA